MPILSVQVVLFAALWAATGAWWAYPVFWWLSWMTQWRVLNRLRAIAEHGGMEAGKDRRVTTHNVRQHWLARLWFVPYNTGWHLAHHVDMGVPWRHLPAFHEELRRAGYVTEELTYPSYLALWRAACAAPSGAATSPRSSAQTDVIPPSTDTAAPVTPEAASEHSHAMSAAGSRGLEEPPDGLVLRRTPRCSRGRRAPRTRRASRCASSRGRRRWP